MFRFFPFVYLLFFLSQPISAAITVVAGGGQAVPAGSPSADIVFKVTDELGNPTSTGVAVNFSLRNLVDNTAVNGLAVSTMNIDATGQVATRLSSVTTTGSYLVTATIANTAQFASTQLTVTAAAPATLTILISGDDNQVLAGQASPEVGFRLLDGFGNAIIGETVNFTLTTPTGKTGTTGLTPSTAITDAQGEVRTRLEATQVLGNYTITAIVATDTTKRTSTNIVVTAGLPARLLATAGHDQVIPLGDISTPLTFQVMDAFDHGVADQVVHFSLKGPAGETLTQALMPETAVSDENGQVSTRLDTTGLTAEGDYSVIATLTDNTALTTNLPIQIENVPNLPSLGFGSLVDQTGHIIATTATFYGGISVNDGVFKQEATLRLNDSVAIKGLIKPDINHLGQLADIVVVGGYTPLPPLDTAEWFYMMNGLNSYQLWDLNIASLESFMTDIVLSERFVRHLYGGKFEASGRLRVYFGYRLTNGNVVYNAAQTINILISE